MPPKKRKALAPRPKQHQTLRVKPYNVEDGITFSLQSTFGDCRQRAKLHLEGWRRESSKEALEFGSLMHRLLEQMGKGVIAGTVSNVGHCLDLLEVELEQWYKDRVESGRASAAEIDQTQKIIAKARGVWPAYCEHYAKTDLKRGTWMELEGVFDVQWRGFRLRGRRDGMRRKNNVPRLFETKTKSQIAENDIVEGLVFDPQCLYYIVANRVELAQRKSRTKPLTSVDYNIIRSPGEKRTAKDATWDDYAKRIRDAIETKGSAYYFYRFEATYTEKQIAEFEDRLEQKLHEFKDWWEGRGRHYWNDGEGGACRKKWTCEFVPICAGLPTSGFHQEGRLFEELEDE
jgi:hypothetical protein